MRIALFVTCLADPLFHCPPRPGPATRPAPPTMTFREWWRESGRDSS